MPLWSGINPRSPISGDGRRIVFGAMADNLVANDTNKCRDLFVHDFLTEENILVSVALDGVTCANGTSGNPMISADGCYVAFSSLADNLVAGDVNKVQDAFVRDLQHGLTTRLSEGGTGTSLKDYSAPVAISPDGRYVVFYTYSYPSSAYNYYVRDMVAAHTYALTTDGKGCAGSMTPDGRFFAFKKQIAAWNDTLYIWDLQSAQMVYSNQNLAFSSPYVLSPDGNRIAFLSGSYLAVTDRAANTQKNIVSVSFAVPLQFSQDGRYLLYLSGTKSQILLYDFQTTITQRITQGAYGALGNDTSDQAMFGFGDRFIVYSSKATNLVATPIYHAPSATDLVASATKGVRNIFLYDRQTASTVLLSTSQPDGAASGGPCSNPIFSRDGKTIIFNAASDLVTQDLNQNSDIIAFTFLCAEISAGSVSGQGPCLNWLTVPGKTVRVQYKNSLNDSSWQDLSGSFTVQGNRESIVDSGAIFGQRFYRVVAE